MLLSSALVAAAVGPTLVHAGKGFTGQPVIAGYWPAYAANLLPAPNIPYHVFTHIDWFVATTTPGYTVDFSGSTADIKTVVTKAAAANVTVSMTVGGWDGGLYFSDLVANATGRAGFANQLHSYMTQYGFSGIDIDWEYPGTQGIGCNTIRPNDTDNLLAFVQELRSVVGPNARLSAAVSLNPYVGPDGNTDPNIGQLANYLDYITVMAYDIYGPTWSSTTGPVGALYDNCATAEGMISGSTASKLWIAAGFPANKIILGLPSYGYPYTTTSSTLSSRTVGGISSLYYQNKSANNPTGGVTSAGAGTDVCGNPSAAEGLWLYQELISTGKLNAYGTAGAGGYTRYYDACSQSPFLFNPSTKNFIAYDDAQSYSAKASYVRANGLAGINMFDLTGDTAQSQLINSARAQLLGAFPSPPPVAGPEQQGPVTGLASNAGYSTRRVPAVFVAIQHLLQMTWR